MANFDALLDKIDLYFENKKKSETYLIFSMIFSVIVFIGYSYLVPITDSMLMKSSRSAKEIEKKLYDEVVYRASVSQDNDTSLFVKKQKTEIENSKVLLERTTYTNSYVDSKLKELSYLLFNNENWANFLNSLTQLAQENSVHIASIENKMNEPTIQKIEQVLTLKVDFKGSFENTMKFINAIEERKLVVDIYELNCSVKDTMLAGRLNIAVWGMKY